MGALLTRLYSHVSESREKLREREKKKKGSGGERRWRKRELKEQSPPQFTPAYPNG